MAIDFNILKRRMGYVFILLIVGVTLIYYGYVPFSQLWWLPFYAIVSLVLGDELIIRHDKYLFKRQIKKDIIKELKEQGYNPKDFDIQIDDIEVYEDEKEKEKE